MHYLCKYHGKAKELHAFKMMKSAAQLGCMIGMECYACLEALHEGCQIGVPDALWHWPPDWYWPLCHYNRDLRPCPKTPCFPHSRHAPRAMMDCVE